MKTNSKSAAETRLSPSASPTFLLLSDIVRSMRLHQWLKNLLLFVPLVLMTNRASFADVMHFAVGFVLLGLLTSGTYLLNDVADIEADRLHPRKRSRPIARGALPLGIALAAGGALVAVSLVGAFFLNRAFAVALLGYLVLTATYSLQLKRMPVVDVLTIAALFTLRIVAGLALVAEPTSEWLLIFSIFLFLSLALMKRYTEFDAMEEVGGSTLGGRDYEGKDRGFVATFGMSSGVASMVIFALFVSSMTEDPNSPYTEPSLLWGALGGLSYWIMRMWLLAGRGKMDDDPVLYALRDRTSVLLGLIIGGCVFAAQLLPS